MSNRTSLPRLSLSLLAALALLLATMTALVTATGTGPGNRSAPGYAAPGLTATLHYKSELGLMPPAYTENESAKSLLRSTSAATITFLTPYTTQAVGSWPQVLAAGDFTQDGLNDLAIPTGFYFDPPNDEQLHLLEQNAGSFSLAQKLPGGDDPRAIVAADLTIDGLADVVVALGGDDALAVYTQTMTTTGALSGPTLLPLAGAPNALALGDFSGDLRNDLAATASLAETIHLWAGTEAGLDPLAPVLPYPTGGFDDLDVGDFDNDGDDDIAALRGAGYAVDSIVIYWQDHETFPVSTTLTPQTGGFLPHSAAVGDVNADGLDDLIVTSGGNTPDAYLNVFLQEADGLSTTPVVYPAWHLPSAVQVEDLNHDGRQDVVLLHDGWRTLTYFEQQADGTLAPYQIADLPYASYHRPDALALADLNGNGGLDVALVGYYHDLTKLFSTRVAPTAVISHPEHASTVTPYVISGTGSLPWTTGFITVTGSTSPDSVTVEVRVKGFSDWQPATLSGTTWYAELELPLLDRAWWIEARAIDKPGNYQAPVARHRMRVRMLCYTIADNDERSGSPDRLMLFDKLTAETALIGPTGTRDIEAIAYQAGSQTLYASNRRQLGTVDTATGVFTPLPDQYGRGEGAAGRRTLNDVDSLAFDLNGDFYGVHRWSRNGKKDLLFKIDPATGARIPDAFGPGVDYVVVDGPGLFDDIDEITFDPLFGRMLGASTQKRGDGLLVEIDKTSGAAGVIGPFGVENVEGLAYLNDGLLYASSGVLGPAGTLNRLYRVDPATGLATEVGPFSQEQDFEGLACTPVPIFPTPPPSVLNIKNFTINNGQTLSTDPDVTLTLSAENQGSDTPVRWAFFTEYVYDAATGAWLPVQPQTRTSNWFDYTATPSSYPWQLSQSAGIKYLQAWVADGEGKSTLVPYQNAINYIPPQGQLEEGQVVFYRFELKAGDNLTAQIESFSGDADLYVWPPDYENDEPAWVSNLNDGIDTLTLAAPIDGIYQVEVHAFTNVTYSLSVALNGDTRTAATQSGQAAEKPLAALPAVPIDDEPGIEAAPPIGSNYFLYLPVVHSP
jgi:hypothetical protein